MKQFNCLKGCWKSEKMKTRCEVIIAIIILSLIISGWILAAAGCNKRNVDFKSNYYFCEEIGNKHQYYGGLVLVFIGVMSLFGWILSLLVIAKEKRRERERRSYEVPVNEYNTIDDEPYPCEDQPLNERDEENEESKHEELTGHKDIRIA